MSPSLRAVAVLAVCLAPACGGGPDRKEAEEPVQGATCPRPGEPKLTVPSSCVLTDRWFIGQRPDPVPSRTWAIVERCGGQPLTTWGRTVLVAQLSTACAREIAGEDDVCYVEPDGCVTGAAR